MRTILLKIWVAITAVLMALPVAMAAEPGGATIVGTPQDKGAFPSPSPGSVSVYAGNIYLANVSTEQSTYHWAGIYGNATGTLVLGDSLGSRMYEWAAKASYVFFDDDTTVNWNSLDNATCTDVETIYTFLTGASDSCANTFTNTGATSFKSIANVQSTIYALTYDNTKALVWKTYAIKDTGNNDVIFAAETNNAPGTAYDGSAANYQVILPENGENADANPTTYYIWIELY